MKRCLHIPVLAGFGALLSLNSPVSAGDHVYSKTRSVDKSRSVARSHGFASGTGVSNSVMRSPASYVTYSTISPSAMMVDPSLGSPVMFPSASFGPAIYASSYTSGPQQSLLGGLGMSLAEIFLLKAIGINIGSIGSGNNGGDGESGAGGGDTSAISSKLDVLDTKMGRLETLVNDRVLKNTEAIKTLEKGVTEAFKANDERFTKLTDAVKENAIQISSLTDYANNSSLDLLLLTEIVRWNELQIKNSGQPQSGKVAGEKKLSVYSSSGENGITEKVLFDADSSADVVYFALPGDNLVRVKFKGYSGLVSKADLESATKP